MMLCDTMGLTQQNTHCRSSVKGPQGSSFASDLLDCNDIAEQKVKMEEALLVLRKTWVFFRLIPAE